MPPIANSVLLFTHVLAMAIWFGGGFGLPGDIRRTLARGKPHTELLAGRVNRALALTTWSSLATIGTGLGLVFAKGGFKAVSPRIHAGLALALVAFAIHLLIVRPKASQLEKALATGEGKDLRSIQRRIGMATGIDHLLKTIVLLLMVIPIETLR